MLSGKRIDCRTARISFGQNFLTSAGSYTQGKLPGGIVFKSLGVILTSLVAFVSLSVLAGSIDEFVREAVEDQSRIDAARQRDASRKPAEANQRR